MAQFDFQMGGETWRVKGELRQWACGKMKKMKDGSRKFDPQFFYSSTEGMLKDLVERSLRLSDANSVSELQIVLKQKKDELAGLYDTTMVREE